MYIALKTKEIICTNGMPAQVEDGDYDIQNYYSWTAIKGCDTYYACRNEKGKTLLLHREIMNPAKGVDIDHRDHNGLNCLRSNLREGTRQQNLFNKKPSGRSKYLGVSIVYDKYIRAHIRINRIKKHLGYFKTEELAAKAYDEAAIIHHGEFANLNFK